MAKNTKISIPMAIPGPKTVMQTLDFKEIVDNVIPKVVNGITIVDWADGTDEEIVAMVNGHYEGKINLYDYWKIGDERQITLSAMDATGVSETHAAQTVTMVLMDTNKKSLVEPINNITKCAFVVGQKNCLLEKGYMSNVNNNNASNWVRNNWCYDVYKNAFPSTISSIFKQFETYTAGKGGPYSYIAELGSFVYFNLPAEREIYGESIYTPAGTETANDQFEYYKTPSHRIKKLGDSGAVDSYWERTPSNNDTESFCCVNAAGEASNAKATTLLGIAPFGVI